MNNTSVEGIFDEYLQAATRSRPNTATRFRLVTANMGSRTRPARPGSVAFKTYRAHLIDFIKTDANGPGVGVVGMQEVGSGRNATRLRGVGIKIRNRDRLELGKVGVHRFAAAGTIRVDDTPIRLFVPHGLHQGTVGRPATEAHLELLGRLTRHRNYKDSAWAVLADFNLNLKTARKILSADRIVGKGPDGIATSPGLTIVRWGTGNWGQRRGIVNHPYVWADVEVTR